MPEMQTYNPPMQVKVETLGSDSAVERVEVVKAETQSVCLDPKKTTAVQIDEPTMMVEKVETRVVVEDIGQECEKEEPISQQVSLDPLRGQTSREPMPLSSVTEKAAETKGVEKTDDKQQLSEKQGKKDKKKISKKWWWLAGIMVATVTYPQQQQLLDLLDRSWYVMTYVADDEMGQVSVTVQKSGDNYLVQASDLDYEILVRGDEVLLIDHVAKTVRAQAIGMEAITPYMVRRGLDLSSMPVMGAETVGETTYVTEDYGQVKGYFASGELVYLKNNENGRVYQLRGYKPAAGQSWAVVDDSWLMWPDDYVVSGTVADAGVPVSVSREYRPIEPVVEVEVGEEEPPVLITDDIEPDAGVIVDRVLVSPTPTTQTPTPVPSTPVAATPTPAPQVQTQVAPTPTPSVTAPTNADFEGLEVGEYRVVN